MAVTGCRLRGSFHARIPTAHLRVRTMAATAGAPTPYNTSLRTCRRCKQSFDPKENHESACRYHSALWTGGEVSKAIGFCRASAAPEDQLGVVVGKTGIIQFWDCCGADEEDAPGCCTGRHVTYDDPE